jgi:4-hydroxy 2-oxovalerate aldolase
MGTDSFSDKTLLELIEHANLLKPYALYFVDSLGIMDKGDVIRIAMLIHHNLDKSIALGFHCHNNLQLAFSNVQRLIEMSLDREIILDASVYGMGRGAGNLGSELIANYLNVNQNKSYDVDRILRVYDQHLRLIRENFEWGYSLPYYLAAVHKCHPNYATYLIRRATLPVTDVGVMLSRIPNDRKRIFSEELIRELYYEYQTVRIDDSEAYITLKQLFSSRPVFVLAPGKTLQVYETKIKSFIMEYKPVVICVNHVHASYPSALTFFSNKKRYEENYLRTSPSNEHHYILTSNIRTSSENNFVFDYADLCNNQGSFFDNATAMLLMLLQRVDCKKIYIAGLDGYASGDVYYDRLMYVKHDEHFINEMNTKMKSVIMRLRKLIEIQFLTPSLYE